MTETPPDQWPQGLKLLTIKKFGDARGFFSTVYSKAALAEQGVHLEFVQDNHSLSAEVGTVRGLHFQRPPYEQAKLVRVVRGAILDVVLDIRRQSPTYGRHAAVVVSREAWNQLYVPPGFAHGFCTLEPDTEVVYKVSSPYSPQHEGGVAWDDRALGIEWPVERGKAVLSEKDQDYPTLKQLGFVGF